MDYLKSCEYSIRLINRLKEIDKQNKLDFELINKAIYWAKKYHDGQFRKSGEPFYTHPLEVAYMISEYSIKTDVIVTSILHDIVEDTEVTVEMIIEEFGGRIAEMVDRLTRDRPDGTKLSVEEILDNAYAKGDKEVLLVKIIDRLHNMQTISGLSKEKQAIQVKETLYNFTLLIEEFSLNKVSQIIFNICDDVVLFPSKNMTASAVSVFDKASILPVLFYQSDLLPNKISNQQELELEKYHSIDNT